VERTTKKKTSDNKDSYCHVIIIRVIFFCLLLLNMDKELYYKRLEQSLQSVTTEIKNLSYIFGSSSPLIDRLVKTTTFLTDYLDAIYAGELYGRKLSKQLVAARILPEELNSDLEEIVALPLGWCDGEGEAIQEVAFSSSSLILLICNLLQYLPTTLLASPEQTINFKFGEWTLIVDDSNTLVWFNCETSTFKYVKLSADMESTVKDLEQMLFQLKVINGEFDRMLFHAVVSLIAPVIKKMTVHR